MAEVKEKQMVFTAKSIESVTERLNDGVILKRYENPWMKGEIGIRRAGVSYAITPEELEEYVHCAQDIHYFVEKYCKVKTEDGSIGSIKLRDYQKDILDNFRDNRFNILCASRQVGKCLTFNTLIEIHSNEYIESSSNASHRYIRFGELYYHYLSRERKLTILEVCKIKIYSLIYSLESML